MCTTTPEEPPLSLLELLHRAGRRLLLVSVAGLAWAFALAFAFGAGSTEAQASPGEDWRIYDAGLQFGRTTFEDGAYPIELAITYFANVSPPARWSTSRALIPICTHQAHRPAWISAELFRSAVTDAVTMWNEIEAAVGYDYRGDCSGLNWSSVNGINEIGWDDQRNAVRGSAVAVTEGRWSQLPGRNDFQEIDIIIDDRLDVPETCFRSIVAHELGHGLGLGHSDTRGDLMYPSFNAANVSTCTLTASLAETAMVISMYGVNRRPVIAQAATASIIGGARATLSVTAGDPEGDPMTYRWLQTGGTSVTFIPSGASISFTAPQISGETLTFRVEVFDRVMNRAEATVVALVGVVESAPTLPPSLDTILPSPSGSGNVALTWSTVPGASSYEFCRRVSGSTVNSCSPQATSAGEVTWSTILGLAGSASQGRVFTSGTQETSMRACNPLGCTAAGEGPHIGGLRWLAWEMDYQYFAMVFDMPTAGIQFTIGGVVNLNGPARRFTLHSGTLSTPQQHSILNCGSVAAGGVCIGLLGPKGEGHLPFVTVASERSGTPPTEHRIRVRE